jgi:type IV pilus assembly protein PilA
MRIIRNGFTLIELMIVIAIIGILAAFAIPAYQDYTVRAQVSEGLTLVSGLKAGMVEAYAARGRWPTTLEQAGVDVTPSGRYIEAVNVIGGAIVITYGRAASDAIVEDGSNQLALVPGIGPGGNVIWRCGRSPNASDEIDWHGDSAALTTVAARFLPAACRM